MFSLRRGRRTIIVFGTYQVKIEPVSQDDHYVH